MADRVRGRMAALLAAAAASAASAASNGHPVIEFDFFRAMPSSGIGSWVIQNFNLASVPGVAKYVHTEVIAEHILGNPERRARKYGIDAIARMRFKVKNPGSLLSTESHLTNQVDFGPFVTYDSGVATNPQTQAWIKDYGGYVGVQLQMDRRWPYNEPYFWYSVTGFCPNLRYDEIPMTREEYLEAMASREHCSKLPNRAACSRHAGHCLFIDGECVAKDPAPQCLNYSQASGQTGHVLGGLCPGGAGTTAVEPTGEPGCTYTYSAPDQVSLDHVVGIAEEDCGGRACVSWSDFRVNCTNSAYRQKFDVSSGTAQPFKYCVEYDINPACESDCSLPACQALPPNDREIGLPFWRGKCDAQANELRAERIEKAFGVVNADMGHTLVPQSLQAKYVQDTCIYQNPGICTPAPGQGGNYCSRRWSGVCTNCFVPGTVQTWPSAESMPYCPYNVLRTADYLGKFAAPSCRSQQPRDLCCLYTGTCSVEATTPGEVSLDDDGFALVASWGNSTAMEVFLRRVVQSRELRLGNSSLAAFAYAQWDATPRKGANLEKAVEQMFRQGVLASTTTTTRSGTARRRGAHSGTTTTTTTGMPFVARHDHSVKGSSVLWRSMMGLAVGLLSVSLGALGVLVWLRRGGCPKGRRAYGPEKDSEDDDLPRIGFNRGARSPGRSGFEGHLSKESKERPASNVDRMELGQAPWSSVVPRPPSPKGGGGSGARPDLFGKDEGSSTPSSSALREGKESARETENSGETRVSEDFEYFSEAGSNLTGSSADLESASSIASFSEYDSMGFVTI